MLSISGYLTLYGDKSFTFRRHLIFNLLSLTLFSVGWILFSLFSNILPVPNLAYFGFLCGLGIVTAFRLIVSTAVGTKNFLKRTLNAMFFPTFIFLLSFIKLFRFFEISTFWYLIDELTIFILWGFSAIVFLYLVNMPIKLLLGINGLTLFRGFTEKWLSHNNELFEESLDKVSQHAKTKIDIGIFYREKDYSIKSILINPWIHPGPFDRIGSSNLPYLLMTQFKKYGAVFVFHSATTHAFNIPKEKYVSELLRTVETYINSKSELKDKQSKTSSKATPLARIKVNNMFQITYQVFGNYLLPIFTASPNEVDDISPEVGELYLSSILRKSNNVLADGTFVDAHNCISSLGENVFYETPLTQSLLESVDLLLSDFSKKRFCKLKVGVAHKAFPYSPEDGYGPGGINILLTESCNKTGALIILDGNNMYPKIREQILTKIDDLIDIAEILTTDTHVVNGISTTGFGYSPIGVNGDIAKIIKLIREGIIEAKNNLELVFFDWNRLYVDTKILGSATLTKLLSGINISEKIAKYFILIATPILILLSYLLLL